MAQAVEAIVTDKFREKLAKIYAGDLSFSLPAEFKIGEGGWTDPGSGKEPVPPDPTLLALTAGTGSYVSPSDFIFTKALTGADLTFTAPARLEIVCSVTSGEANDDGNGNPPEFFELGIFDGAGDMLVYSTFPIEIKTVSRSLEHTIFIDF